MGCCSSEKGEEVGHLRAEIGSGQVVILAEEDCWMRTFLTPSRGKSSRGSRRR